MREKENAKNTRKDYTIHNVSSLSIFKLMVTSYTVIKMATIY